MATISYAININWELVTINAKPMATISYAININWELVTINTKPMATISYAININWELVTINAKPMATILNLIIKTGNDNSFAVNSSESLYQLMYF